MVNRGDAVGSDEWRELPIEKQMAFRLPISIVVDLPHLRARYPVMTVSKYLHLHGMDPETEVEPRNVADKISYPRQCLRV